mgnify:CR=1 FL=1
MQMIFTKKSEWKREDPWILFQMLKEWKTFKTWANELQTDPNWTQYNLEDRIKDRMNQINNLAGRKVDITVKKDNKTYYNYDYN